MRYKTIGSDRTTVAAIGIGCMGLGGYFTPDVSNDQDVINILHLALDNGMTFLDTAEIYGGGHGEELIGHALKDRRHKVYLSTKVSPENLSQKNLIEAAEKSLKRLKTDYIDLYQIHWPDPKIPIAETIDALESLVKNGKIRHIGLSNFSLSELTKAEKCMRKETLAAVQAEYNLFDRTIEADILPYCQNKNIAFIAYSPLDQGYICGGQHRQQMLEPIAKNYHCSVAQLALAWLIHQPAVIVIPKAFKREHVIANAQSSAIELSENDAQEIARITAVNLVDVPTDHIRVVGDANKQRQVYRTVDEARANIYGFSPSPVELAANMQSGELLKAVRVRKIDDPSNIYDYDLIEGRIRYWAWVIAFEGKRNIPVLVRE